jgi:hypothetical protein
MFSDKNEKCLMSRSSKRRGINRGVKGFSVEFNFIVVIFIVRQLTLGKSENTILK